MKVLSFDAATKKTGWAFIDNKKLIDYGLIRADEKEKDYDVRIMQIYLQIKEVFKKFQPDYIVFENTPSQNNPELGRQLSRLHGCIMSLAYDSNGETGFRCYMPSKWRSAIGTYHGKREDTKRDIQKQRAIEYVNKKYKLTFEYDPKDKSGSDDICEAICLAEAFEIIEI